MGTCSLLATRLDSEMLTRMGVTIYPSGTPDVSMNRKDGPTVSNELCGRYLLKYLLPWQLPLFDLGREAELGIYLERSQFLTPTPYSPEETVPSLALPVPDQPRYDVMLIDPAAITTPILGPRWVRLGSGIEYVLPDGFDLNAVVNVGTYPDTRWPIKVS